MAMGRTGRGRQTGHTGTPIQGRGNLKDRICLMVGWSSSTREGKESWEKKNRNAVLGGGAAEGEKSKCTNASSSQSWLWKLERFC